MLFLRFTFGLKLWLGSINGKANGKDSGPLTGGSENKGFKPYDQQPTSLTIHPLG